MPQPECHDYIGDGTTPARPARAATPLWRTALRPIASLTLTIVLFVLSMVLVFFGTLAQKYDSLNTVLDGYFYCWVARLDLNLLSDFTQVFAQGFRFAGSEENRVQARIWFPGGFTLGWLMVVNLTAAHIVRFKTSWKRLGLWVLHAGVIALLAGEYVRANYAVEDQMRLREGESASYLFSLDRYELVLLRKGADGLDEVISIPGEYLAEARPGTTLSFPDAPYDIEVVKYMRNTFGANRSATIPSAASGKDNPATAGLGLFVRLEAEKEVSSIKGQGRINQPGAYVTLKDKATGQAVGTYLVATEIDEVQPIGPTGEWRIGYRLKRTYLPYSIQAVKIERVNWPGTEKPKEFKSTVRVNNPSTREDREVVIQMNDPLRYEGRTFYQSSMDTGTRMNMTGFQVVRNPGSTIPYVACIVITLGMTTHFLIKLVEFLGRRRARS